MVHGYEPKRMVPPIMVIRFCSSIILITGSGLLGSISTECACFNPNTFLAYSITAICIPKQIPKNGNLFSLAYCTAIIFPSIPLLPKPGATNKPSKPFNFSFTFSALSSSLCTLTTFTFTSFIAPA